MGTAMMALIAAGVFAATLHSPVLGIAAVFAGTALAAWMIKEE